MEALIRRVGKVVILRVRLAYPHYLKWAFEFDGDADSLTIDWNIFRAQLSSGVSTGMFRAREFAVEVLQPLFNFLKENREELVDSEMPELFDNFLEHMYSLAMVWDFDGGLADIITIKLPEEKEKI